VLQVEVVGVRPTLGDASVGTRLRGARADARTLRLPAPARAPEAGRLDGERQAHLPAVQAGGTRGPAQDAEEKALVPLPR
jgi:hypothetical protein